MFIVLESIENIDFLFYVLKFYIDIIIYWCINGMLYF